MCIEIRHVQRGQTRATIEHRRHVGDVLRVEVRQVKRCQTGTTPEHVPHVGDVLGVEVRQVKRSQTRALGEHPTHVSDVLRVKVRQVKRSQTRAIIEHPSHVGYVLGVEVRQVKRSQARATIEHPTHVFHFRSVEVFQPFDLLERTIIAEPPGSGGGKEISERRIEHHTRGGTVCHFPCSCPCREGVIFLLFRLLNAPSRARTSGTLVVVVEGELRLVRALRHIGFHASVI